MYKHILITTDLTDDNNIIQQGGDLAQKLNAQLSLVHVIEPVPSYGYSAFSDIDNQGINHAKEALAKLGENLNVEKGNQHIEVGQAKKKILQLAENLEADLIITGSHGKHGLAYLLGSTANAILHGATCDVLTIRNESEQ